ncbi:MAG: enoyl-CoA hydratase/isomerase family protein [Rhodospirillaceae bacterium]|jgi:enoyl-CoA hydratase/carnithine racemase|nr:enoyl-CoA hydratase/isomerase family protein [Rhodospirillaceae bacterium]MBT4686846.1 enoyl-CoA hydratase/isomerase family protein [Rhodospirillaceae bacterium]MBT5079423.1 enoyl-CoA hydratase/isomerase family protein [Rhodospirillaceae bacterium]MBT5526337.1 enoyl-CoA hydratase/isomerase family protein [Rhodospirillaceae bacterium]MBT5881577.1 enoyl-CoA hydratase/isomerase family protein [Rhodospirillaceae bacterium]
MDYQHIKVERGGEIATITFNRPEKANALNDRHIQEIEHAALSFRDDENARVVVFTGAGKHFNSGADLTGNEPPHPLLTMRRRQRRIGERCIHAIREMDQITIAAWKGAAMGGGACIATAVDFRIGARDCFMSYPEVLIGVNLMWQSLPLCVQLVGPARAKRLVISGEHIHGPTLLEWGALDEMVEADEVMDKAMEWARLYASQAPVAAQMIKRSVNAISSALDRSVMHMDVDQHLLNRETEDAAIAVSAYLAKEPPTFKGN